MTDYSKLVKALRCCIPNPPVTCEGCEYDTGVRCNVTGMMADAADAIKKLVTLYEKAEMDATNLTGKLAQAEAEVERLKDSNEELREKQTYIDHYGAEWMTSAKDVPTAAYEHGYADGRDEAEAQLPKRGEIVRCGECRYRITAHGISDGWVLCSKPYTERGNAMHRADWFCADGEREVQE